MDCHLVFPHLQPHYPYRHVKGNLHTVACARGRRGTFVAAQDVITMRRGNIQNASPLSAYLFCMV
jgi:hypothetical protein